MHSMTIPISFFKTGGSGKRKAAPAFILLIFPREAPMSSDFAGARGLVCAGISLPAENDVRTAEITRRGSAAGQQGAEVERGRAGAAEEEGEKSTWSRWWPAPGGALCLALALLVVPPGPGARPP